jgi:HSP20 family protein
MLLQQLNRGRIWDSFREMERLQSQLNSLLAQGLGSSAVDFPPLNIWTSQDGAVVTAEIPGVSPENIDISVVNQTLTLRGSRESEQLSEDEKHHRRERGFGQFTRTIELPFKVNSDGVEAKFCKGILNITLPRAEADKPRKISVTAE